LTANANNLDMGNLYGHVENVWGIPFAETKERKCEFLVELLQE
jgi:hypothetical protein